MPSGGDVTTVPGGERPCRSRRDEGPVPVTAGGRGEPCAGSPAHETVHREQRRGGGRRGARDVSVPGWGRGEVHEGHGRAERYEHRAITRVKQRAPSKRD